MAIHLPRHDVAAVPLQGGYVAKRCPVRAFHDHNTLETFATEPVSEVQQARMDDGIHFEAEVFDVIIRETKGRSVILIDEERTADMIAATNAAMTAGVEVILGGALPADPDGRRTGRPDVLVRVAAGYIPIDVKHHTLAKSSTKVDAALTWSPLASIDPADPSTEPGVALDNTYRRDDGFQLAHYWRMLEAAGHAPDRVAASPVGGIIDKSLRVWWINLDDPMTDRWWSPQPVSLLEWYDWEYAFRLDVIAQTLVRNEQPDNDPAVVPVRTGECGSCRWNAVCSDKLERSDHVSLLPGSTWDRFVHLRRNDLLTRRAVANLDWMTAFVVHGESSTSPSYDLSELHDLAAACDASSPIDEVTGKRRKKLLERLSAAGVDRAGDVDRLDHATAALPIQGVGHLPSVIDIARAAVAGHPFRARGLQRVDAPRADVEIDIDMENTQSGVYLWGAQTTIGLSDVDIDEGYRAFVSWAELDPQEEVQVLARCWKYLSECREIATSAAQSFAVYFYTSAETTQVRRILATDPDHPDLAGLAEFIVSDQWVDLHHYVKRQLVTGGGLGLKTIAPLADFSWRDDDPGGEQSMLWHALATQSDDTPERTDARARILQYNEDDVRATLAIRDWMYNNSDSIPAIETWGDTAQ